MFESASAAIFADDEWFEIPAEGGALSSTGLECRKVLRRDNRWNLLRWEFVNRGTRVVTLGSCHMAEIDALTDSGADDLIYLDSGGGWFAGVVRVNSQQPNGEYEYWKPLFVAEEDIAWASEVQNGKLDSASHYSFGGMSVYLRPNHPALLYGFMVPPERATAMPFTLNDPETGAVRKLALVCNFAGFELAPGQAISSEEAIWRENINPFLLLEEYASYCARVRKIRLRHSQPPAGWLSWYGYRLQITEDECERIADFIRHEYPGFDFKYMQIDLGYNSKNLPGEWFGTNDHFPEGLSKYASEMRKRGFVPGIWCGLFTVAESSEFYQQHPDAVFKKPDCEDSHWFWDPKDSIFYLDPTHPEGKKFIGKVMHYFKTAGLKYFKIDFMNRLSRVDKNCVPFDRTKIKGPEIYCDACRKLVQGMEPDDYFYSCSNTILQSAGFVSTSMTACDIGNTGIRAKLAKGDDFLLQFYRMQFGTTMARWYLHKRLMLNNPDAICIAPPADLEEAWFRTLFVGLSGGQVFLGDRFDLAEPDIRTLVRKVLPVYGEVARPADLFEKPFPEKRPEILHLQTPFREIIGLFNFDSEKSISIDWRKLGISGDFEGWEFFERKYLGVIHSQNKFAYPVPFPAARLLMLTPVADYPQVIATDFHITGGAVELCDINWDPVTQKLEGTLIRPAGDQGRIYIKVPKNYRCALCKAAGGVVSLPLTGEGGPLAWSAQFEPA